MRSLLMFSALIAALAGCAGDAPRRLQAEQAFDTDSPITRLFHASLYYPSEIRLQHDGFIVGVDESPRERVSHAADIRIKGAADSRLKDDAAHTLLDDGQVMFVSHIMAHREPAAARTATSTAPSMDG